MTYYNRMPGLTREHLMKVVPAAFAEQPAEHVSDKYQFVRTADILESFWDEGWDVIAATQQNVRDEERISTTKHSLILAPNMDVSRLELGGILPTFNLTNSADWSSLVSGLFGMMRLLCTNGMMAKGANFMEYKVRHDQIDEDLNEIFAQFRSKAADMMDIASNWETIELSPGQVSEFGMNAARIRFGEQANSDHANALLLPRRHADNGNTLWRVFNRVQENATKKGAKHGQMKRAARELTNIRKVVDVNTGLFELAESFASDA